MDDDDCQFVVTEPVAAIVNQRVRQHRTVAEENFTVAEKVDALYASPSTGTGP